MSVDAVRTIELTIKVDEPKQDLIVAYLSGLGFEGFLQDQQELKAYIESSQWTPDMENEANSLIASIDPSIEITIDTILARNWNALWEASVQPISVDRFLVTPSWKQDDVDGDGHIVLVIDPKMSFGTGYHATTRLMLRLLPPAVGDGDRVLDAGTGTGILAIAAARLGAISVLAIDTDPWSERNARENCFRNDVADIVDVQIGDVTALPKRTYDVILANIQLDVIIKSLPDLCNRLASDGKLLLSGILTSQSEQVLAACDALGLASTQVCVENEWWAVALTRRTD